jgi:hypothetical protein
MEKTRPINSPWYRRFAALGLFVPVMVASITCDAQQSYRRPSDKAAEIAQLPKYCYAQYVDTKLYGNPEYEIGAPGTNCGPGMNHFCPALMMLIRAQNPALARPKRKEQLRGAKEQVNYTLQRMQPQCLYREDVYEAMRRIQALEPAFR